jgi:hypothetical protein
LDHTNDTEGSAMADLPNANEPDPAGACEIRLVGRLDGRWAAWFDGLSLTHDLDGTTVLRGPVADQAALHGLLQKVRDIGLPLVSVTCIEPDRPAVPSVEPR